MSKKFEIEIQVRFKDLDPMQHVNNSVYFSYFEIGRLEFFRNIVKDIEFKRYPFILARVEANFLKPITVHHPKVILKMWAGDFGNKSFKFFYEIESIDRETKFCSGESVQVFYDYKENKTIPVPEDFKELISDFIFN